MLACLIQIDAQNASGGAVTLRLASDDIVQLCHLGGAQWDPALASLPAFALDFFGGAFSDQITAPGTSFAVATFGLAAFSGVAADRARFARARCRIWVGDPLSGASADLGPLTLRFDGWIEQEPSIDEASRTARFEAAVDDGWADNPLLPLFAGTGGIEGPQELQGQPKPLCLGNVRFARGVLIDNVDNVWMVSNGPVQGISAVYDRLASLGPSSGNHANLAALLAASVPNGSWATCLAQGLVRLGAPPDGRVSFDVQGSNAGTGGYVRRAGAMMRRLADLAGGTVNTGSLTALDTARPYNQQLQLLDQTTAREVIGRLADSVAAVAGVSLTGELFARALGIVGGGEALNGNDTSEARIAAVEELPKLPPAWRLATEAEPTFEVHSLAEIAFQYRWQGEWSAVRVYRRDDVVTGPDSASWVYINASPAAGQALPVWPATSNSHWQNFSPPPYNGALADVEPGATLGATLPSPEAASDPDDPQQGNIRDQNGQPYTPGELLNSEIELTPDGRLQYFELPNLAPIPRGQITLPDLGAASQSALRQAQDDTDKLATALATALEEASRTRQTFTSAGFFVDEATGQVRIIAIDQTAERVGTAEIRLNAAEAAINLRATFNYVDEAILNAVLDPSQIADLNAVFVRLTAAELGIDGLNATVTTLATATELSLVEGRVTTAEQAINALEGTIVTKVDNTTFSSLDSRVTSAETTLSALGDVAQFGVALSAVRAISREQDDTTANNLLALLLDDKTRRDQVTAIADARQELTARIIEGDEAEAAARLALQARVGQAEASIAQESIARTNADGALSAQITSLNASFSTALNDEQQARATAIQNEANARQQAINAVNASIQQESQTRANADGALAGQINSLTTTVNGNTASINQFATSINGLEARWGVLVDVNGRVGGFVLNNDSQTVSATFLANQFAVIDPVTQQPFIDADASGLRLRNGRVIMDNGVFIKAVGVGFGTQNQFIEWFGPRPAGGNLALCSEANAIAYLKTNGDAFFGGSLSAGILRNAAQTSDLAANAQVEIGPFGTNGNPILVVTSYNVVSQLVANYPATAQGRNDWLAAVQAWGATPSGSLGSESVNASKSISCNVSVGTQRSIGGGSFAAFSTLNITSGTETLIGVAPTPGDAPGLLTFRRTVGGSVTATDNVGGTQNRTFRATLNNRTSATIGTIQGQSVGIVATEQ